MDLNINKNIQLQGHKEKTVESTIEKEPVSFEVTHPEEQQQYNVSERKQQKLFSSTVQEQLPEYCDEKLWKTHTGLIDSIEELKKSHFKQKDKNGQTVIESPEMEQVKSSIDELVNSLNCYFVLDSKSDGAIIDIQKDTIWGNLKKVISDADSYLGKRKWCFTPSGRYRRDLVKSIKLQCEEEMSKLESKSVSKEMKTWFLASTSEKMSFSGTDILRFIRSELVETKKTALSGGNNSDVFQLEKQDERIFKKQEILSKDIDEIVKKINEQYSSIGNSNEEEALKDFTNEVLKSIISSIKIFKNSANYGNTETKKDFDLCVLKAMASLAKAYSSDSLESFKTIFNELGENFDFYIKGSSNASLKKSIMVLMKKYHIINEEKSNGKQIDKKKLLRVIRHNSKVTQGFAVAKYNGISEGTNLSLRNIATYRTAKMLDMGELVTESHNVVLKNQNETSEVLSMEKAKGVSFFEFTSKILKNLDTKDIRITPEVARDINRLQTLDLICGQCDRHENNFFVDYKEIKGVVYITKIQGIDNDMAFGKVNFSQLKEGFNRMAWLFDKKNNVKSFKRIDRTTFEKIGAMKKDFEVMKYRLNDTGISDDEFSSMKARVDQLYEYFSEGVQIIDNDRLADNADISDWFDVKEINFNEKRLAGQDQNFRLGCVAQYFKNAGITRIEKLPATEEKEKVELKQLDSNKTKLPKYLDKKLGKNHEGMRKDMQKLRSSTFKQKNAVGKEVTDSEEMTNVKNKLDVLNNILEEDFIPNIQKMDIDKHEINNKYKKVIKCYDELIESSEDYINKRKTCYTIKGYKRRSWVKNILKQCKEEKAKIKSSLAEVITWYSENKNDLQDTTNISIKYSDLLRFVRSEVVDSKKQKVKGGMVSDVFTIQSQENRIYKKSAKLDYSFGNVMSKLIDAVAVKNGDADYEIIYKDILTKVFEYMRDKVAEEDSQIDKTNGKEVAIWESYKSNLVDKMLEYFTDDKFQFNHITRFTNGWIIEFDSQFQGSEIGYLFSKDKAFINKAKIIYEEAEKTYDGNLELDIDTAVEKNITFANELYAPTMFNIKTGETSMRNIATYRMAKMLNMTSLVPECHNVMLNQGDENIEVLSMQKAKGISFEDFSNSFSERKEDVCLTPSVVKDINRLQLFDLICGQRDRHAGNFFLQYEEKAGKIYVTGITGIDHDFSFGRIDKNTLAENGILHLANFYGSSKNPIYNHIDKQTYDSIIGLQERMQELRFNMIDVGLENEEFSDLVDRINDLAENLKKRNADNDSNDKTKSNFIISYDLKKENIESLDKMYLDITLGDLSVQNCVAGYFIRDGFTKIAEMPS